MNIGRFEMGAVIRSGAEDGDFHALLCSQWRRVTSERVV
jgi:hypothetical protein